MPELPIVAMYKRFVDETSLDQTIVKVDVEDERLLECSLQTLQEATLQRQFTHTTRIGKFIFLHTDAGKVIKLHFGMTGKPAYFNSLEAAPRFTRVTFSFAEGGHFGFVNIRKFGRIDVDDSVEAYQKRRKLGQDALDISQADFVKVLQGRNTLLKAALLQQQHFAGVGNWIADEILFQAGLRPDVRLPELSEAHLKQVHGIMHDILNTAILHEADHARFPDHFVVQRRWGDGICPQTGDPL
ncbi:MAG: DNA-formamidopyrimidine glycosylase family protein, partial [Bacteroidia bacterium]